MRGYFVDNYTRREGKKVFKRNLGLQGNVGDEGSTRFKNLVNCGFSRHLLYTSNIMAVIGIQEVVRRIKEEELITGLGGRDLSNPEGTGIDLRLGAVHKIAEGGAFIEADGDAGLGKRSGVKTEELYALTEGEVPAEFVAEPGEYYLIQTAETINTPLDLMPLVYPRSSLFRAGLLFLATKTDPGYKGKLTFGLTNLSRFPVKLQLGARICNIVFNTIEGDVIGYRGQHQGGRISHGEERQV
jgi:deoxycytidine triphosphate deaminase